MNGTQQNSRRVSEGAQYKPWLLRQKSKGGQTLIKGGAIAVARKQRAGDLGFCGSFQVTALLDCKRV